MSAVRLSTVDDLSRSARRHPDRVALHFADRAWTYRELDEAVSRAAAALRELGLGRGDRVAAYDRNSDAYLLGFLGCSRAGLVHVPVNYALTGEELAGLAVGTVLALRDADGSLLERATTGPVPDAVLPDGEGPVDDGDLVQLLHTSGTTSRPKGAVMAHRALVHEYVSCVVALAMGEHDDPLHPLPLHHSAGMHVFLMPYLAVGAVNHLMEAPDVPEVLRLLEERGLGAVFLAPTVWVPLTNHPDFATRDLSSLRKAFYGASVMPGPVLTRLTDAPPDLTVWNCFGQSEIGPLATVLRPEEHAGRPDSCARPVLFVEGRAVDEASADVTAGGSGEVLYRSPQLCEAYWDKPETTAGAFADGWFRSGDLVRIDAEGYLTVVDRIKDVINTGGVLVASREVEAALHTHPAVAEVAVDGIPDDRWIEAVTAFVVLRPDAEIAATEAADALIAHARGSVAGYKVRKHVHLVAQLPRNQSGKLLKRMLRDRVPG